MYKFLSLFLLSCVLFLIFDKYQNRPDEFARTVSSPLGELAKLNEYLMGEGFIRHDEAVKRIVPEFGIPARVVTYQDTSPPKKGDSRDQILIILDFWGAVRGVGGVFVPMVAIPPHIGKTEKIMKHFWASVDKHMEMKGLTEEDMADPEANFSISAANESLDSIWSRNSEMDRIFVVTKLDNEEKDLKKSLVEDIEEVADAHRTKVRTMKEKRDTADERQEKLRTYRALLTERKLLAGEFRQLREYHAETYSRERKKQLEDKMKKIKVRGIRLNEKIRNLEESLPANMVDKKKSDK